MTVTLPVVADVGAHLEPCCADVLAALVRTLVAEADVSLQPDSAVEVAVEAAARAALNKWRWHAREHRREAWRLPGDSSEEEVPLDD